MLPFVEAVVGVGLTLALAVAAVLARALTPVAGAAAAVFGSAIVILAGFPYLLLLVLFVVASVLATRYGFDEKRRGKVQEGREGERGLSNVLAHILLPVGLVLLAAYDPTVLPSFGLALLYASALAFGAADTFASEFGVLAGHAVSILTLRPVRAGTNGGVSTTGEVWAIVGAILTAVVGLTLFYLFGTDVPSPPIFLLGVSIAGFVGCQVDSLLGETLENRGYLTKGSTNFLAMVSSILVASLWLGVMGG
ncbi:MAG: DUF92 domain-containing protein [Thermoplasmata archaeon]